MKDNAYLEKVDLFDIYGSSYVRKEDYDKLLALYWAQQPPQTFSKKEN